jgi:hypothetical protein
VFNPNASAYAYNRARDPLLDTLERLERCTIPAKDRRQIDPLVTEWFTHVTLNSILTKWEDYTNHSKSITNKDSIPMTFVLYSVQGLNSRT